MKLTDYCEEDLDTIKDKIRNCTKCKLSETRTNAVPGDGDPDADVMFIGEAPGEYEDKEGKPFVGKAGKNLDEYFEEVGLNREDVFISNVVKCRPPDNRDPHKGELKSCHNHTMALISAVDPEVVCLLGRVPTMQLTGKRSITKARGKKIDKDGRIYFPTFHPAALIYDPSRKEEFIQDLKKVKEISED